MLSRIEPGVCGDSASDAGLIVSELVTNSVRHAPVSPFELIVVDMRMLEDRMRITVSDPGSQLEPRLLAADPAAPYGFGLRLVNDLSAAWGVTHEPPDTTQVWCELIVAAS